MKKKYFKSGQIVSSRMVKEVTERDALFKMEVQFSLDRHFDRDWGVLSASDKKANDEALRNGDSILSAYMTTNGKIWVKTESDRSVTTVLFPDEC